MTSERARVVRELSGFKLLKELGQGGMGKVYLARQTSLDRDVALKVLVPELAADQEFVARFHREAKSAARFQHPNIVAVFDQGLDPTSKIHYIAFEFVDGGSLEELLERRQRLPEAEALPIIRSIATALEFAEHAGIVHRDVKPENILLTRQGLPKLADLGLAKQTGVASTVTQSGVVLGTPLYMAPEQALGEPDLDGRADLYALGLVLWRTLTGVVPFDEARDATPLQLLAKHINQDLPDVRTRAPEVSEGTAKVIGWLAQRDRAARYVTASDVLADLDLVMRGEAPIGPHDRATVTFKAADLRRTPSGRVVAQPPPPAPRLPVPTVPILVGVLVGALGIGVGLALAVTGRKGGGRPKTTTTTTTTTGTTPVATPSVTELVTPVVRRTSETPTPTDTTSGGMSGGRSEREDPPPVRTSTSTGSPTLTATTTTSEPVPTPAPALATTTTTIVDAPLVAALEDGLRHIREGLLQDADAARPAWEALSGKLEALPPELEADSHAAAAIARLSSAMEAFFALLEAKPDARLERERALDGLIAAAAKQPLGSPAGRVVDAALASWGVLLADVAELEAILGETDADALDARADKVRSSELAPQANGLVMLCKAVDGSFDRGDRPSRPGRREERELRPGSRRGALHRLLNPSMSDLEATVQRQRPGRGENNGWGLSLARGSLELAPTTSASPFLAARVVDVAPSMTGQPLGSARGLLIMAEGRLGPGAALEVHFGSNVVVIDPENITFNGKQRHAALAWGDAPVIVLELRKSLVIAALDARTGAVLDSHEFTAPKLVNQPQPVSYGVEKVGLTRVALLQPIDGAAHERVLAEHRARAARPRAWRD